MKIKVLVISDNRDDFEKIEKYLSVHLSHQYIIDRETTFGDGLYQILEKEHDIYLVDYVLNGKSGHELIQEALRAGCVQPIIVLIDQDIDPNVEPIGSGVYGYLDKNLLNPAALEKTIQCALQVSSLVKDLCDSQQMLQQTLDAIEAHMSMHNCSRMLRGEEDD